jgi:outer membrane protein OmpA-like peptidoglycan-associated protein
MSYTPLRKIGRYLLAACAVSLGTASLSAQTAPSTTAPGGTNPSRVDIFMGYSYFGAHGQLKPQGIRYSSVDEGAALSGAYWFNKYVGGEFLGFFNPDGQNDGVYGYYAGPIFRAPMQNFTLFAHGLAGGVKLGGPNSDNPATFGHNAYTWGPGLVAGGGMDYDLPFLNHRLGLRLFEADYRYIHASFGPAVNPPTGQNLGGRANIGAAELSTGLLLHFGHIIPPPPVTYACSVTAPTGTIYPGDAVTVTGTAANLDPKKTPAYTWTSDSGPVSGTSNVASVSSNTPGTYTVKGHVTEGNKPGQMADCSAQFTVTPFQPPTVGCSANPSSVNVGDPSTITAVGSSPQNRPLTYSYSSTAGSVSGNTSTATLTTTGVAPGTISVTCNVVDDKGQTASQMTTVTVIAPAPPQVISTTSLCTISFDRDVKRPTRVDNEAKACLDDITLAAQRDPQAKLAIIGNAATDEPKATERAASRAVNEKDYLVTEKGIDASRISVYTGAAGTKTGATTLIPAGATLDMTGLTPVDESAVKAQPRNAPAKKHKKKK